MSSFFKVGPQHICADRAIQTLHDHLAIIDDDIKRCAQIVAELCLEAIQMVLICLRVCLDREDPVDEFAERAGGGKNLMGIWERFVQSKALPLLDNDFLIVEDLRELASLPYDGKGGAPLALRIDSGARRPSVFLDP